MKKIIVSFSIEIALGLIFALAILAAQYATTATSSTFVYQQF